MLCTSRPVFLLCVDPDWKNGGRRSDQSHEKSFSSRFLFTDYCPLEGLIDSRLKGDFPARVWIEIPFPKKKIEIHLDMYSVLLCEWKNPIRST